MEDVKKTYIWQDAVALAAQVVKVCEEFTQSDGNVLVWHLRQSAVDVPASIASDLISNHDASLQPLTKLGVELELVNKIYPAIDIEAAKIQLQKVMERIQSGAFAERQVEPAEETAADESADTADDEKTAAHQAETSATIITPSEG
jgi:hypothetical protein